MVETLDTEFNGALHKINLEDKVRRAKEAHETVRAVLEADPTLGDWGVDTILIGSYARDVAIWPGHDVDVFVKLPAFNGGPEALYEAVRSPLKQEFGSDLDDSGAHALTISFGSEGFSVDAVGATNSTSGHWVIPAADSTGRRAAWEPSDPERLGELAESRNKKPLVGEQGAYKPIVKLVRQIRQHHLGDGRPRGLYFEMLTYWAFEEDIDGGTYAELLAATLALIADQLESGAVALDPALNEPFQPAPSSDQLRVAAGVFREQADRAAGALTMDLCPAAATWRTILGENDNGWVFPLPEGCDASGKPFKKIRSLSALGSDEARGFAGT